MAVVNVLLDAPLLFATAEAINLRRHCGQTDHADFHCSMFDEVKIQDAARSEGMAGLGDQVAMELLSKEEIP